MTRMDLDRIAALRRAQRKAIRRCARPGFDRSAIDALDRIESELFTLDPPVRYTPLTLRV